ncbi:MAG: tRNA (N6-threonylcarbamoyladenosine(37)-N6)-methyltransferase TrmO [Thermodesulfobacteriota bacterium]|nr:tRNA (N6-threonylcarbamoyladenosine(37)-N6)-methyltransferase TrmO [Thermodesulfobacteriota bacterium]
MTDKFEIFPVGIIKKQGNSISITVFKRYEDALLGLDQFSHIIVYYWFHKNDSNNQRNVLQVHPRGNRTNPLTGIFATHSPQRPNLIGSSMCKILSIDGNIINIDKIDAFDDSPVIDIKPYIFMADLALRLRLPSWAEKL